MKKKLVVLCLAAVLAVSAFLFIQSRSDKQNDLLLANVEALAGDESGGNSIFCTGQSEIVCFISDECCYFWVTTPGPDFKCFFPNKKNLI